MIRLPAAYEQQIIDYAKQLDSESELVELPSFDQQLNELIDQTLLTIPPSKRIEAKKLFRKLQHGNSNRGKS